MNLNGCYYFNKSFLLLCLLVFSAISFAQRTEYKLSHQLNSHPTKKSFTLFSAFPETLNVYAVRVQFQVDNNSQTTGDGRFDLSNNYPDSVDAPPHDSAYFYNHLEFLKNYYFKSSKGKLIINFSVIAGVRNLSQTMENYSPRQNENLFRYGNLFNETWRSVDSVYDFTGINPSNSAFAIFHAGVGRDVDLTGIFQGALDLPSIYLGLSSLKNIYGDTTRGYYTNEGLIIPSSCILPEQEWRIITSNFGNVFLELGLNGIIVGTIGSHLGLPDLFDTQTGKTAIGRFGLMDGQSLFSYLGVFPPEPSAWEKQYLGWVQPNIISTNGTYFSRSASIDFSGSSSVNKVFISAKEYFLIENRNRDAKKNRQTIHYVRNGIRDSMFFEKDEDGFISFDIWKLEGNIVDVDELDWSLPGLKNDTADFQGGLLIWHIDENVIDANILTNTINTNIEHRGVDLEEAKGAQEIGVTINTPFGAITGDGFFVDYWYNGNHYVPSNIYRNEFTSTSIPNSKSYSNFNSGVCLRNFSVIDSSMSFTFERCGTLTAINTFPRFVGKDTSGNAQPIGFDFNGNGLDEIFVNVKDSLYGFRDNGNSIRVDMPNGFLKDSVSNYIAGYLNYNISGQNKFIVGVYGNKLNLLYFNIDSATSTPNILSYSGVDNFSTPLLVSKIFSQPDPLSNRIYIGTINGKVGKFILDSLLFRYDSLSNRSIKSLALGISGTLPFTYNFIDDSFKFFASSSIFTGPSPFEPYTFPVKITGDNKVTRVGNTFTGDSVISNALGINVVYSSPTVCDLNGDGQQDIIFSADNKIYAINKFGVVLDNFPFSIVGVDRISSGIAVADLNGDNVAEVIFGTGDGRVYAYGTDGRVLDGFPVITGGEIKSTPAIINSEGNFGLLIYSQDGYLYGYKTSWVYDSNKVLWKNFLRDRNHQNLGTGSVNSVTSSGNCLPKDKVYNWPNPVYGKTTNVRYYLGSSVSAVKIKIMDLSGELVATLNGTTNAGFDNEVPWDVSTVQSGIYIGVVELEGGCGEKVSFKIAVVR